MITLQKITLKSANKIFPTNARKFIRFSVDTFTKCSQGPATVNSELAVQWNETFNIPLKSGQAINFEVYDQHKFGYNPEELSGIFQGVLQVIAGRQQLTGNFENQQREIIGHLEAKVTTRRKTDKRSETVKLIEQPLLTISETSNNLADGSKKNNADSSVRLQDRESGEVILKIISVVAHIPIMKGKQAYLVIKMGKKSTTTEHMNSRTGELVFISEYTLKAESSQEISIELRAGPEADSTSIGVGKVTIEDGALRKKVILYDNAQKMVGELYVDGKLREANGANYLRINSSFKKEDKNIAIDNINSSSPHLQNSRMGAPARSSRIALSGAQSEIKFSRSPRFMETEKKSDYCSYLGLYNFEFREKHSNRFYKGASIGKGVKSDFTLEKNQTPGVGMYNLPSIWDRH